MKTATPSMARAINDRLALDLLLRQGPLTAPQLRTLTGLSRPTVSDLIERLRGGGLIEVTGERGADRRGPNARLYGLVRGRAHVAGVDVRRTGVHVTVADITGEPVGSTSLDLPAGRADQAGPPDLAALVARAVTAAAGNRPLHGVTLGVPGLVDPSTGDLPADNGVPGWRPSLRHDVRRLLGVDPVPARDPVRLEPVRLENEVNLAAVAEHRAGAAAGRDDFALLWLDRGVGAAVVLGGRLRRGASGGAGEVGLLGVEGATFCDLLDADAVRPLSPGALARHVAAVAFTLVAVLDPGLVVLAGATARAGGAGLAALVADRLGELSPAPVEVRTGGVEGNAILQGAVLVALDRARDDVYGRAPGGGRSAGPLG